MFKVCSNKHIYLLAGFLFCWTWTNLYFMTKPGSGPIGIIPANKSIGNQSNKCLIFQNHFLRKHKSQDLQDVKEKHLVQQEPLRVSLPAVQEQPSSLDISAMDSVSENGEVDDDLDLEDFQQEDDPYLRFRDDYCDFLGRLESVHHVSQPAVVEIAAEIFRLSSRVLTHCMEQVADNLGNVKPFC